MPRYTITNYYVVPKYTEIRSELNEEEIKELLKENPHASLEDLKAKFICEEFDFDDPYWDESDSVLSNSNGDYITEFRYKDVY